MNLRHLHFFVTAVDCRGVTKAAERLHVSQPAVSAGIQALEEELGQQLLDRSAGGRSVRPTPKGAIFYERAVDILRRCEDARRIVSTDAAVGPRHLRIGVLPTIPAYRIATVAARLAREVPDRRWRLREGSANRLLDWLRRGRIDLAWTVVEEGGPNANVLWREPYVVLVAQEHPLARRASLAVVAADLAEERLVLRTACEMRSGVLQAVGLDLPSAAQVQRDDLALDLVAQGSGIAIGPRCYAGGDVVALRVAELTEVRSIGLRWRSETPSDVVEAVVRAIGHGSGT